MSHHQSALSILAHRENPWLGLLNPICPHSPHLQAPRSPPARGPLSCCFVELEKSLKLDALHVPHQHGHLRTLGRLGHEHVLTQQALRLGRRVARALAIWSVVEAQRPRWALWFLVQLL